MRNILTVIIVLFSINITLSAQIPCDGQNPCGNDYWSICLPTWDVDVSPGNPLNNVNIEDASAPSLKQSGNLLFTNDAFEKVVFLRGAGEYNEVMEYAVFNGNYNSMMTVLQGSGFNMVRIFVYSGNKNVGPLDKYPFVRNTSGKYHLHHYNDAYFTALEDFVDQAELNGIQVLLCLFDFSGSDWDDRAWHPANNDHSTLDGFPTVSDKNGMFNIWDGSNNLNYLGLTQRDFVLKVVREMRHHKNVIFEIANEPKDLDHQDVVTWAQQIAKWIHDGYASCDGAPNHLRAITNPKEPGDRDDFLNAINSNHPAYQLVNMYSEHNAYRGSLTGEYDGGAYNRYCDETEPPAPSPTPYSRADWEIANLSLNRQAESMSNDLKTTNFDMVLLCDTDGLHRRMPGSVGNITPFGRDFDSNCKRFANIAFINRAQFNTKEQLYWTTANDVEIDCKDNTPGLESNVDDFIGEDNWDNFDATLGDAVCGLDSFTPNYIPATSESHEPLNYRHLTRSAGFFPLKGAYSNGYPTTTMFSRIAFMDNNRLPGPSNLAIAYCTFEPNSSSFSSLVNIPFVAAPTGNDYVLYPDTYAKSFYFNTITGFKPVHGETYIVTTPVYPNESTPPELLLNNYILSDPWPMLYSASDHINNDSSIFTPETPVSGSSIPSLIGGLCSAEKIVQRKSASTYPKIRRRCSFDPNTSKSNDEELSIFLAGWGCSNLHDICPGYLELEIGIYDPAATNTPPSTDILNASFQYLKIRNYNDQNWFNICDFQDKFNTSKFTIADSVDYPGLFMFCKFVIPLNKPVTSGFSLFELALFDDNGIDVSNTWPRLEVVQTISNFHYIDTRIQQNNVGSGTILDPYSSVDYAISQISQQGTLSQPNELVLVSGRHKVSDINPIILDDYMNLCGENGAVIELDSGVKPGHYIEMGRYSQINNLVLECGILAEHSYTCIRNCTFKGVDEAAAVKVAGFHDLKVENCIFRDCDVAINAEGMSILNLFDTNIVNCKNGVCCVDKALVNLHNNIFFKIENTAIGEQGVVVHADDDSEVSINYCAFFQNECDWQDNSTTPITSNCCVFGSDPLTPNDPGFIDWINNDYHLVQSDVRNTQSTSNISPCVNTGEPRLYQKGTTSTTGERDIDQYDIGYHYPEEVFKYNFPRFKADDGVSTDYRTEISIYNPSEYTQNLSIQCKNLAGTEQDFNGTTDGNILKLELEAGETWFRVLVDSCSVGDNECIEAPCSEGSITIESDGPLFGQYRIVESNSTTGTSSWMLQMQRADLADDGGSNTTLSCDSWVSNFGGGSNSIETEIVLHNLTEETNTVSGTVYNNQGTPVPSDNFTMILDAGETDTITFDSSSTIDYGNMEFSADGPVTGEMIYHCQNQNSSHNFSEGVILLPSTLYSDMLTAPFVQIENFGTNLQESYVCLKNPNNTSISAYIDILDDQGNSIYTVGTPTPTPLPIPAHGSRCIGSYNFPVDWGSYSMEIDIAGTDKVIGHQEVLIYESTNDDFSMAGCELDHHLETPNRFFVPYCTLNNATGQDYEATWIVLRNNSTSSSVSMDLAISAFDGTPLDNTTITLGSQEIRLFSFGSSPALLDPGTESQFVLTIEADDTISGWVELYRVSADGSDMAYDANKLHSW